MNEEQRIEAYSLNAWPALRTFVYEGWLLRFADGYTKRSNSVQTFYGGGSPSKAELETNVRYCEDVYSQFGQPTIFKMTPFSAEGLDAYLAGRGYTASDHSRVMVVDSLPDVPVPAAGTRTEVETRLTDRWLALQADFNGMAARHREIARQLLAPSPYPHGYVTLYEGDRPVAVGLGVIEEAYVGLYDIVTSQSFRNRGFGEQLIHAILGWAREYGAIRSYLQVVQANAPANRLYAKLGYRPLYDYHYRCQPDLD